MAGRKLARALQTVLTVDSEVVHIGRKRFQQRFVMIPAIAGGKHDCVIGGNMLATIVQIPQNEPDAFR